MPYEADAVKLEEKASSGFLTRARKKFASDIVDGKISGHSVANVTPAAMGDWERGDCITCKVCGFACPSCQTAIHNQAEIENVKL